MRKQVFTNVLYNATALIFFALLFAVALVARLPLYIVIPLGAFAFLGLVREIRCIVLVFRVYSYIDNLQLNSYVTIKCGGCGSGKSSSMFYSAVEIARANWAKIRALRWKYSLLEKTDYFGDKPNKLQEYREVKKSYEYFTDKSCFPCLFTNIPIKVDGQFTSVLEYAHATQEKFLPYGSVLVFDEIGAQFLVDDVKKKPLSVSDFFRLCRHFGDFRIFGSEQEPTNIYKDVRRVVGLNEYMLSQNWILQPKILMFIYDRVLARAVDKDSKNIKMAVKLDKIDKFIHSIGFREYTSVNLSNTEFTRLNGKANTAKFYTFSRLNYEYDDRVFKNLYKAKNARNKNRVWSDLTIQNGDKIAKSFLRNRGEIKKKS